jgi:CubicO group peptidase (beta-lactamase class C family)
LLHQSSSGFGEAVVGSGQSPTLDTIFEIGSISKVFVAIQTFQMLERGIIRSLYDPLSAYDARFSIRDPFSSTSVGPTLHQLLSQTSGLPREVPCDNIMTCNSTMDQILGSLATMKLVGLGMTFRISSG